MRKVTIGLLVLGVLALAFISMPMRAQNQGFPVPGYPPEFAPSRTSRPDLTQPPLPTAKFHRVEKGISNEYIVLLNDDTPAANLTATINALASAHGGVIKNNYGTFLKGFSVRMPEAAAIALSNDPRVKYVVQNGVVSLLDNVPWGLVRINQELNVTGETNGLVNGTYSFPNDGSGVHVYVVDTGMRISHNQFNNSRASYAYDAVDDDNDPSTDSNSDGPGVDNIDCQGHGTLVSSVAGGNSLVSGELSLGVAKGVTLHSVRAIYNKDAVTGARSCGSTGVQDEVIKGMYWVAQNALKPAVVNLSLGCNPSQCSNLPYDPAAKALTDAGVTAVAGTGNDRKDIDYPPPPGQEDWRFSPANEPSVIAVGGNNSAGNMYFFSNYGKRVDVFAPGSAVLGAAIKDVNGNPSDSATRIDQGTSMSVPHVVGVAAMYLHDHPSGTASLPAIVKQVIMSNANICKHDDGSCVKVNNRFSEAGTTDRLLYSNFFSPDYPMPANPIDNQRFFVWQQYRDFLAANPDEQGLDFWTRNIAGGNTINGNIIGGCGLDRLAVNINNSCTHDWRINTSLAFWVDKYPSMFTTSFGLTSGNNSEFVKDCYSIYLKFDNADQRDPDGFRFWKGVLDSYGDPASPTGVLVLIDQFLNSTGPGIPPGPPGYRVRFGAS